MFFSMERVSPGTREGGNPISDIKLSPVIHLSRIILPGLSTLILNANVLDWAMMISEI